ncbi:MAG: 4'-phosphopantetheinyl transferase superfamily protein [Bacteriovoracaceae bacterium]|nr:4'-phosphopantetheinyl transferase superfamily protein [Bacteriovoracaceae bacterium]
MKLDFSSSYHCIELPLDHEIEESMNAWMTEGQKNYAAKRKQEYLAGRYCAKKACEKINVSLNSLPMADDRSPIWPEGIVGSISHTHGLAIAAVSDELFAIGLDAETMIEDARFDKIKRLIVTDEEISKFNHISFAPTLIFSAKEALYKTLHPKCKEYFGFLEATVDEISTDTFSIRLHSQKQKVSNFNKIYNGKYAVIKNTIISWIEIPKASLS